MGMPLKEKLAVILGRAWGQGSDQLRFAGAEFRLIADELCVNCHSSTYSSQDVELTLTAVDACSLGFSGHALPCAMYIMGCWVLSDSNRVSLYRLRDQQSANC